MPEFYQANIRPVEDVEWNDIKGSDEAYRGFSVEKGDVYKFPAFNTFKPKRQRVQRELRTLPNGQKEKPAYVISIPCVRVRNGESSNQWFSLNFLKKQDANREYVNPTWMKLDDAEERAKKLCEMTEITVLNEKQIRVAVFENGRPKKVPTLDPNTGEQRIDEQGTAMEHVQTEPQTAYVITPVA
jgi:hypothetical protein